MLVFQRRLFFWTDFPIKVSSAWWAICTWENDFIGNLCSENCYAIVGMYGDCTDFRGVSDRLQTSEAVVYLINWSQACGSNDKLNVAICILPRSITLLFPSSILIYHSLWGQIIIAWLFLNGFLFIRRYIYIIYMSAMIEI